MKHALTISFGWLNGSESAELARDKFKRLLEADLGFQFSPDFRKRFPQIPIENWYEKAAQLETVLKQVIAEHGTPS